MMHREIDLTSSLSHPNYDAQSAPDHCLTAALPRDLHQALGSNTCHVFGRVDDCQSARQSIRNTAFSAFTGVFCVNAPAQVIGPAHPRATWVAVCPALLANLLN